MSTLKNSLPDELIALWSPENEIEESHLIAVGDDSDENNAITMDGNAEDTIIDDSNGYKTELSDREKLKAAYALNLCTVSVSQIVKDRDQYIMDQEYDAILNNLNLQNLPDDESLLKILKEILDVITFFKIQEGDRAFIEEDYKQALKQNLTSAVNIGGLVGSMTSMGINSLMTPTGWVKAGITVATTIGVGYMNYRSGKNQARLNKKKKEWELQRAAIEQLNGLRRELFDTAWHITKNFEINDDWRLTENQISQYLKILEDPDDYRRFERLDFIKDKFYAYPPFWYQLGHTARLVSISEPDNKENYEEYARSCFKFFLFNTHENILRDDLIASSCALEYAEMLDKDNDRDKIRELLSTALKYSGNKNDVVEMCAIGFLRIEEYSIASRLLWRLVNEKYDENFNAELLSIMYCRLYIGLLQADSNNEEAENLTYALLPGSWNKETTELDKKELLEYAYELLRARVTEEAYLIPLPDADNQVITEQGYLRTRSELIKLKADDISQQVYEKYRLEFLNIIMPESFIERNGLLFDYHTGNIEDDIKKCIQSIKTKRIVASYIDAIKREAILIQIYYAYEHLFNCLAKYIDNSPDTKNQIRDEINDYLGENRDGYKEIENALESMQADDAINTIEEKITLFDFQGLMERLFPIIQVYYVDRISRAKDLSDISDMEQELYLFSKEYDFEIPVIQQIDKYKNEKIRGREQKNNREIDPSILGIEDIEEYEKQQRDARDRFDAIVALFKENRENLIKDNNEKFSLKIWGDDNYEQFLKGRTDFNDITPIAVIWNNSKLAFRPMGKVLAFDAERVYWIDKSVSVSYSEVDYDKNNKLKLNDKTYSNSCIDFDALRKLIEAIIPIADKTNEFVHVESIGAMEEKAKRVVNMYTTMAAVNGVNPVPVVGIAPGISIQVAMLYRITKAYRLDIGKDTLKSLSMEMLKDISTQTAEQQVIKAVALMLVPGSVVINGVISAGAAGALTYAMGMSFSEYCKGLLGTSTDKKGKSPNLKFNISDAISVMKPSFEAHVKEKGKEIIEAEQKNAENNLTKIVSIDIEETKQELEETAEVIQKSVEVISHSSEEITQSSRNVRESMDKGWDEIRKQMNKGKEE